MGVAIKVCFAIVIGMLLWKFVELGFSLGIFSGVFGMVFAVVIAALFVLMVIEAFSEHLR